MKLLSEFLFWFHLLVIILAVFSALALSPIIVLLLIIAHELHVYLFHGCALTQYEKKLHGLPENSDFFQYLFKRLLGVRFTKVQARLVNYSVLLVAMTISLAKYFGYI